MNLQTLTERAANSEIRELELLSIEGGFYLARVRQDHASSPCWMMRPSQCTCVRSPTCENCCTPYRHFLAYWCSNACTTKCAAGMQGLSRRCAFRFRSPCHCDLNHAEHHWMNVTRRLYSFPSSVQHEPSAPKHPILSVLRRNHPKAYVDVIGNQAVGPLPGTDLEVTALEHQLGVENANGSI